MSLFLVSARARRKAFVILFGVKLITSSALGDTQSKHGFMVFAPHMVRAALCSKSITTRNRELSIRRVRVLTGPGNNSGYINMPTTRSGGHDRSRCTLLLQPITINNAHLLLLITSAYRLT